ncbi:MAG: argininosuccinate lyase [Spirochaetales bacterium]|jgi:argininosuccinate lyase|nr:argininosuccinate lyase [Spirochaetales bacterium]
MAKLWEKNYSVDALLEEFTVGQDYSLDRELVPADCVGSMAHGRMLCSVGILTENEEASLHAGLAAILREHTEGKFSVLPEDEDCHTAIENRLVRELGDTGKKIHTGRSRNDQILTALRLYARSRLLEIAGAICVLAEGLLDAAQKYKGVPMPGRTHTQVAMPSSVGLWFAAWAEEILDDAEFLRAAFVLLNRSPLGSAASYGTPLPLDRELCARLLGFPSVHNNVLAANNSRGKVESRVLDALDGMGITLSKMASDLILFSLPEFGYFSLPAELCTGSSIMPQKKNPDGLELTRARASVLGGCAHEIKAVIRSLPSGYNRDFQETKEPFLRGLKIALSLPRIMDLTVRKLSVNADALRAAFTPEIFATDAAYALTGQGMSFRDAYREVGLHLDRLGSRDPQAAITNRTSTGTAGNLRLEAAREKSAALGDFFAEQRDASSGAVRELAGFEVNLSPNPARA